MIATKTKEEEAKRITEGLFIGFYIVYIAFAYFVLGWLYAQWQQLWEWQESIGW